MGSGKTYSVPLERLDVSIVYITNFHLCWQFNSSNKISRPKRKSKSKKRKPRIPQETIDLIKQMTQENPYWGAEKIGGERLKDERLKDELLKLGISIGKPTIQKYMKQVRRQSGQNWTNFLKNHAQDIWACDFTVVYDLLFRPIYIFIIIAHQNREIKHAAVTRHLTDAWVAQQLREATP